MHVQLLHLMRIKTSEVAGIKYEFHTTYLFKVETVSK
jgi:hypothetical protein